MNVLLSVSTLENDKYLTFVFLYNTVARVLFSKVKYLVKAGAQQLVLS